MLCWPHCVQVEMYAGAVFVQILFGWNMYVSGVLVLAFSALFTMTGVCVCVCVTCVCMRAHAGCVSEYV